MARTKMIDAAPADDEVDPGTQDDKDQAALAAAEADEGAVEAADDSPDKSAATKDNGGDHPQQQKTVPHGAFEKERQGRKAAQRELEAERRASAERFASLQGKLDVLNQVLQPPAQTPPSPEQDIFGAFNHLSNQFSSLQQERQQEAARRQQADQQNQHVAQITSAYMADAARFRTEQPDFNDAYQFLLSSRQAELSAVGYDAQTVQNAIRNDELNIVGFALQQGASPAETVYRLAQSRGYRQGVPNGKGNGNGAVPANGGGNGQGEMQRLQRAQDASTTLSRGGGSAGGVRLTLEAIDRMPNKEFEALVKAKNAKDPNGFDAFIRKLELGNAG